MTDETLLALAREFEPGIVEQLTQICRALVREEVRKWASAARDAKLQEVRFIEKEYEIGKQKPKADVMRDIGEFVANYKLNHLRKEKEQENHR